MSEELRTSLHEILLVHPGPIGLREVGEVGEPVHSQKMAQEGWERNWLYKIIYVLCVSSVTLGGVLKIFGTFHLKCMSVLGRH